MRSLQRLSSVLLLTAAVSVFWPAAADAQHRRGRGPAVRAPRAVRVAPVRSRVIVGGYYGYGRYYYDPFFYGYYGFSPWFAHPHYFYSGFYGPHYAPYYGGYYGYGHDYGSSVRLQVTPRHAEVYVDGYLAGTVDDFDGFLQRLRLPPGQHEIVLYLDGFQTVRQNLHLPPGTTYRVRHTMVPLASGQAAEPRPAPASSPQPAYQPPAYPRPRDPGYGPAPRHDTSRYGTLRLRVQPGDAVVLIDGEEWRGPDNQDTLVIQLSEGTHRVEVQKTGYARYTTEVRIRQGETSPLNISLARE